MKRLVLLFLVLSFVAGCGNDRSSHASILIDQGQEYIGKGLVPQDEYGQAQLVGTVSEQVTQGRLPTAELSSNELPEETEIYLLDETRLLAKVNDREFRLFEQRK